MGEHADLLYRMTISKLIIAAQKKTFQQHCEYKKQNNILEFTKGAVENKAVSPLRQ